MTKQAVLTRICLTRMRRCPDSERHGALWMQRPAPMGYLFVPSAAVLRRAAHLDRRWIPLSLRIGRSKCIGPMPEKCSRTVSAFSMPRRAAKQCTPRWFIFFAFQEEFSMTQVLSVALSVAAVFLLVRLLSTPLRWFLEAVHQHALRRGPARFCQFTRAPDGALYRRHRARGLHRRLFRPARLCSHRADADVSVSRAGAASHPTAAAAGAASRRIHAF